MSLIAIPDISTGLQGPLLKGAADRNLGSPCFRKIAEAAWRSLDDFVRDDTAPRKIASVIERAA